MPLLDKLIAYFQANQVPFTHTEHSIAYTAREVASAEHLPAREVAKTIVVTSDERFYMLAIPANRLIDFHEVRMALGLAHVRLATEFELSKLFPDCELGAMPPVGVLCGLPVYLDGSLAAQEEIAFNAGTHRDVIHMKTEDYRRLVHPTVAGLVAMEASMGARHGDW